MTGAAPDAPSAAPTPRWLRAARALKNRKMLAMMLLALAAGIPYGAVLGTLNAWLTAEGITPSQIGVLNFIILAYSFKLIWAPAFQRAWFPRIPVPWLTALGPRRAWLMSMQLCIAVLLALLALSQPASQIGYLALVSVLIAIASSVHDLVLDAWRIEIAETEEDKDLMSALYQFGYRIAGLFTGLFALVLADHLPWSGVYLLIAAGMALASLGTLVAREPVSQVSADGTQIARPTYAGGLPINEVRLSTALVATGWAIAIGMIVWFVFRSLTAEPPPSAAMFTRMQAPVIILLVVILPGAIAAFLLLRNGVPAPHIAPEGHWTRKAAGGFFHTVLDPLMDLVQRLRAAVILVLALVLMYRFVDLIWGGFAFPFYLGSENGALGHSNTDVALASKTIGVLMTVAGAAIGGAALIVIGRMPCLFLGAALSAVTNLLFADLAAGGAGMDAFLSATGLGGAFSAIGVDPKLARLIMAIGGENLASGFASVAFVAYLTAMVNPRFAAVQYALLGSLTMLIGSLGRAELGVYIEQRGFHDFFVLTAWMGLIAVALCALEWVRHAMGARRGASAPAAAE
jgi:MFS transporter, PAT family, beta-lactamase induction signal transducer AmpG